MGKRTFDDRPLEVRQDEWLAKYPDRFIVCREGHDWPKTRPGRKLARTKFEPWTDPLGKLVGCYYQEQTCANCGRVRFRVTGPPHAFYSQATKWEYRDPRGYATPPGLGIPRARYIDMLYDRILEQNDQYTTAALAEHAEAAEQIEAG